MYYYLLAQVFHWDENAQKNDPNYPHAKKNISIFLLGSVAYIFTAAFLFSPMYQLFIDNIFFLSALRDWFPWFLMIDIFACCILFKQYWGFGILTTVDGILETKASKAVSNDTPIKLVSVEQIPLENNQEIETKNINNSENDSNVVSENNKEEF